ncbi:MAG: Ig-like domain-containing protein [Candidatus Marinimicrobia bacterium]|jgi:hypothetical protein|nr:Ig-like domain-containing protein [Candidatus Neomarinimicrobiota bacterium]MBT7973740.1 Ig-like domain-containing protein [Candidatus Neomarinimicrobiota bacterium]
MIKRNLVYVLFILAGIFIASCEEEAEKPKVTTVTVSPTEATILREATQQFTATVIDQFEEKMIDVVVSWSSSDETVATVDANGLATGVKNGETTITATADGISASGTLTVSRPSSEWYESFNTDGAPNADQIFTSDFNWAWWGWGSANVTNGALELVAADDPFGEFTCWVQTDQSLNSATGVTPEDVTMYLKVKFTSPNPDLTGPGDAIHVCVATDENFLANLNVYTAVASPAGIVGSFHFGTGAYGGPAAGPGAEYDKWFWMKITVVGNDVSIWTYADGEQATGDADWTYGTDLVDDPLKAMIIAFTGDDPDAKLHIDDIYYNIEPGSE